MVPVPVKIDTTTTVDTAIYSTALQGFTVPIECVTQGGIDIVQEPSTPELNIAIIDSAIDFVGEVLIDSNIISGIKPVDSVQIKNPPTADSTDCNNMKYY